MLHLLDAFLMGMWFFVTGVAMFLGAATVCAVAAGFVGIVLVLVDLIKSGGRKVT